MPAGVPVQTAVCFDFFSGEEPYLINLLSSLYIALIFPNWVKRVVIRQSWVFSCAKNTLSYLIGTIVRFWSCWSHAPLTIITATVKFGAAEPGHYAPGGKIIVPFFQDGQQGNASNVQNVDKLVRHHTAHS
jgi:hypothetical protein